MRKHAVFAKWSIKQNTDRLCVFLNKSSHFKYKWFYKYKMLCVHFAVERSSCTWGFLISAYASAHKHLQKLPMRVNDNSVHNGIKVQIHSLIIKHPLIIGTNGTASIFWLRIFLVSQIEKSSRRGSMPRTLVPNMLFLCQLTYLSNLLTLMSEQNKVL